MSYSRLITIILIAILTTITSGCSESTIVASSNWSLIELVTKGEQTNSAIVTVEVRNCGIVERKTHDCSAGTSNDLSVSLGGNILAVNASINSGLGIGRNSGQSLSFDSPPEGFIYRYTVREEYRIATGDVKARSSSGAEQVANYSFRAGCSLKIESQEILACSGNASPPQSTKQIARPSDTPLPARRPTETPIPPPTPVPDTRPGTILEVDQTWYQNGKSLTLNKATLTRYAVANSEAVNAEWIFSNTSTHDISTKITEDNFNANNNIGKGVTYKRFYNLPNGNGSTVVLAPGESIEFSIDLWIEYSDPSVDRVTITVSLSDIQNARWDMPIYH